ncbi:MAG: acyl-CoA dehydratase activase [Methanosarcinales archaeon]|nr:acyl-CoA dehydratase activase [Methanosarcinales archaeon]
MNIGLDVGSTTAKVVHMENGKVIFSQVVPSQKWMELIDEGQDERNIVSTGYFRKKVPHCAAITEITTASLGARYYDPKIQVIIDIGGQDTKVIDLRNNTFLINDKCSAGTGAFLELAAHYFDIPVGFLGELHSRVTKGAMINNTCGVFAISEMISQLVGGYSMEEVIYGLHQAFALRIAQLVPPADTVMLIGGTVQNIGIVDAITNVLDSKITVPCAPQLVNALGAALYRERLDDVR